MYNHPFSLIHMPNHTLLSSALHTTSQGFQALLVWPWGLPFSPRVYIPLFTSTGQSDSPRNIPASVLRSSKATGRINFNWTNATRAENPESPPVETSRVPLLSLRRQRTCLSDVLSTSAGDGLPMHGVPRSRVQTAQSLSR